MRYGGSEPSLRVETAQPAPSHALRHRVVPAVVVAAVVLYVLLALAWFDHGIATPLTSIPAVPLGVLLVACLAFLIWSRGLPRPFDNGTDNRLFLLFFALAIVSRMPFLAGAYGLFSADSAIHGVMALHILDGSHHPVFAYGESYDGGLKAHVTALVSLVAREPVLSFAAASALMYAVFVAALFALARTCLPRGVAAVAAGYAILSPGFLTAWSLRNDGSYVEVLAFGTGALVLGARLLTEPGGRRDSDSLWMGVLCGLAFWSHILATYYLIAVLFVLVAVDRGRRCLGRLGLFAAGFALGDLPGILWNVSHEWLSFRWWGADAAPLIERITRGAANLSDAMTTSLPILAGWWPMELPDGSHSVLRVALILLFPAAAVVFAARERAALRTVLRLQLAPSSFVLAFFALVVIVFAGSSYGWLTEDPRYLIFLFSVVPLFVASSLGWMSQRSRVAAWVVALALFSLNLYGSGRYLAQAIESDAVNRGFIQDVEDLGVRHAHSDYYIAYKYNFLSLGRLVFSAALGPAQTERYPTFREEVMSVDESALVPRSYRMARRITRRLDALGIRYRRADLLYPVIFDLSERVELPRVR